MKTKERTQGTKSLKEFLDQVSQKIVCYRGYHELYQPIYACLGLSPQQVILITGETGVGKELIARAIHDHSDRSDKPFVSVNCGKTEKELIESKLFGHVKGAFSGAHRNRKGKFEEANGGVLFLDEIVNMSLDAQVTLLRVLEDRRVVKLGDSENNFKKVDVKIIAGTNKNLPSEVDAEKFKKDLYYRLKGFAIYVRPLRSKPLDIPVLVRFFIEEWNKETKKKITSLDLELLLFCICYDWPGNVRELKDFIRSCHTNCKQGKAINLFHGEQYLSDENWKIPFFRIVMSQMRECDGKHLRDLKYFGLKKITDLRREHNLRQEIKLADIPGHGKYFSEIVKWRNAPKEGCLPLVEQKVKNGEPLTNDEKKYREWMKLPLYEEWKKRKIERANYETFIYVFNGLFRERVQVLLSTVTSELKSQHKEKDFLNLPYQQAMSEFEKEYLGMYLERNDGNQSKAAKEMGIDPQRLQYRLKKLNL